MSNDFKTVNRLKIFNITSIYDFFRNNFTFVQNKMHGILHFFFYFKNILKLLLYNTIANFIYDT